MQRASLKNIEHASHIKIKITVHHSLERYYRSERLPSNFVIGLRPRQQKNEAQCTFSAKAGYNHVKC